jgi:two-component system, NarL family, sensor kinase
VTTDAESLRDRNRELEILTQLARALNRPDGLEELLGVALARVSELLALHTGWIYLLNEETSQPYLAASRNLPPGLASNPRIMTGGCYCLDTFRDGDLAGAANINVVSCSRLAELMGQGSAGLRFHSSIPLESAGRRLGVLNVAAADWRQLSEPELRILRTVGDLLCLAIDRSRLTAIGKRFGTMEDRGRHARELLDTNTRSLSALVLQLEKIEALAGSDADRDDVREQVRRSKESARACLEDARRAATELRAAPLEGRTLLEALEELSGRIERESNLEVTLESHGTARRVPDRIESGLFEIAAQALSIVLGGDSRHVRMVLSMLPSRARLAIEDDGRSFDVAESRGTNALVALAERAKLIGGILEIVDLSSGGARILISVPFDAGE